MWLSNSWHIYIFRISILGRIQWNQNFLSPPTQIFSNAIFSKMRRQKKYFDFKFGISVKFRVEWCKSSYDSCRIYSFSLYLVYLHAYAITISRKNLGKFKMNYMKIYINRRGILRWFQIWSQNNIFAYAF